MFCCFLCTCYVYYRANVVGSYEKVVDEGLLVMKHSRCTYINNIISYVVKLLLTCTDICIYVAKCLWIWQIIRDIPSKLVVTINNFLVDLFICQASCQNLHSPTFCHTISPSNFPVSYTVYVRVLRSLLFVVLHKT